MSMDGKRSRPAEKKRRGSKTGKRGDMGFRGRPIRTIPAGLLHVDGRGARFVPVRGSIGTTVVTLAGGALVGMILSRRAKPPRTQPDQAAPATSAAVR
jgi:hypothetical protein